MKEQIQHIIIIIVFIILLMIYLLLQCDVHVFCIDSNFTKYDKSELWSMFSTMLLLLPRNN